MIVIFCDNIDDFSVFLERRIMDEVFYEIKDVKDQVNLTNGIFSEIILHFLAKVSNSIVLYETKQKITDSSDSSSIERVIQSLKNILNQVDPSLKLIKGKIREIFLSYSS